MSYLQYVRDYSTLIEFRFIFCDKMTDDLTIGLYICVYIYIYIYIYIYNERDQSVRPEQCEEDQVDFKK